MAERADFVAAVRALAAAQHRAVREHPAAEEIVAYTEGTLDSSRVEGVSAHLAACPECADLVLDYGEFRPETASTPVAPVTGATPVAVGGRRGSRDHSASSTEAGATPLSGGAGRRPVAPLLLIAATLVACLLGAWVWTLHRELKASLTTPRLNVAAVDLAPDGSDRVRGTGEQPPSVDLGAGATLFLALHGLAAGDELRVAILDADGRELWSREGARIEPILSNVSLHLPTASLPPARYKIRVSPAGGGETLATFTFDVR